MANFIDSFELNDICDFGAETMLSNLEAKISVPIGRSLNISCSFVWIMASEMYCRLFKLRIW